MNTPSVGARFVKEAPMTAAARTLGCAIAVALLSQCLAAPPNLDSANEAVDKPVRVGELKVRVVDPDGHPVAQAKVSPWALQCSLGHDHWAKDTWACDLAHCHMDRYNRNRYGRLPVLLRPRGTDTHDRSLAEGGPSRLRVHK